jgi:prevent-host-death family protein
LYIFLVKTVTVKELKAQWAEIEARTRDGESFLVLNHGRPAARILPPEPQQVLVWDDHLATAAQGRSRTAQETVRHDRDGRW